MIRTFLFDMGNVLLHFCHDRMCRQIGDLCGRSGEEMRKTLIDSGWQWDFEGGSVTPDQFHNWFQETFQTSTTREKLAHAASDIFTLNEPMAPLLEELKRRGHRLVLLSNTSVFHYEFIRKHFQILDLFDDFVLSFEVKAIKPSHVIYEAALKKIECAPGECFYTDDIPKYVDGGRRHGLDSEVFTTATSLMDQLADRGIRL